MGVDLIKDPTIIQKAYNFTGKRVLQGITNMKTQLQGNLGPENFYTHRIYDPVDCIVKSYVVSK